MALGRRYTAVEICHECFKVIGIYNPQMLPQALLCDRDGTLIQDEHFLSSPEKIQWIPGVLEALKALKAQNIKVLVLTNQSGVARGYFGVEAVEAIHAKMQADVELGEGAIADFYYCPHHPQGEVASLSYVCNCRKPLPGLFLQAIQEHHLTPNNCWVVGDRIRDLEPGLKLGMKAFLVKTGYGLQAQKELTARLDVAEINVILSLTEIIDWIGKEVK